jgi:hypothetical protein
VADTEISKRGSPLQKGSGARTPRNTPRINVFWVSNIEFYSHLMVNFREKGGGAPSKSATE